MTIATDRLIDRLAAIEPIGAAAVVAAERLACVSEGEAVVAIDQLLRDRGRDPRARRALVAVCRALHFERERLTPDRRSSIARAAVGEGFIEVAALVGGDLADSGEVADEDEPRRMGKSPIDEETLGHRRQRARVEQVRDRLLRLAHDDDATVIRNLLWNPRMSTPLVVRIAARRPVPAAVLEEVARSERWGCRAEVRRAVALNPHADAGLAVTLLPLLSRVDLAEIVATPSVPALTRLSARTLGRGLPG